jgi:hypothetical protein
MFRKPNKHMITCVDTPLVYHRQKGGGGVHILGNFLVDKGQLEVAGWRCL